MMIVDFCCFFIILEINLLFIIDSNFLKKQNVQTTIDEIGIIGIQKEVQRVFANVRRERSLILVGVHRGPQRYTL